MINNFISFECKKLEQQIAGNRMEESNLYYQEKHLPVEHTKQFEKDIIKEEETSQEAVMLNYEAPKDLGKRTTNRLSEKTDISFFENLWKRLTNNDKFGQPKLV